MSASNCVTREIERVAAYIVLKRPDMGFAMPMPALTAEEVDEDVLKDFWLNQYGLNVDSFDVFEIVDTENNLLAVR